MARDLSYILEGYQSDVASRRAAAIKDEAAERDDALITGQKPVSSSGRDLSYILSSAAPRAAIPPETTPEEVAAEQPTTTNPFAGAAARSATIA